MTRVAVLLAAGASRRFGQNDKLLASLGGKPLLTHAAEALRASDMDAITAVTRSQDVAALLTGFDIVVPETPEPHQSDSLRAGVHRAQQLGATRLTIVLADMPFVTPSLIDAVTQACTDTRPAAATDGRRMLPPVCFPAPYFDDLLGLQGDRGAASLLSDALSISASDRALFDVDTPDALAEAKQILGR